MRHPPNPTRPPLRLALRGRRLLAGTVAVCLAVGLTMTCDGFLSDEGPPQPTAAAAPVAKGGAKSGDSAAPPLLPSTPLRLRIPAIRVDAPVAVTGLRMDGRMAVFTVYGIEVYKKRSFPTHRVYADRNRPELRTITCGGTYSKAKGYSGNVVVCAHLSNS